MVQPVCVQSELRIREISQPVGVYLFDHIKAWSWVLRIGVRGGVSGKDKYHWWLIET